MNVSRKQMAYVISVLLALLIGFFIAVWLYQTKKQVDLTSFTVAILSGVISLVALFIAVQTFLSIDSVNNITKMDGNILDNEYYVTSIPELLENYKHTTPDELRAAIVGNIRRNLREHSDTAVDFADTLQGMIDVLVLFPAMRMHEPEAEQSRHSKTMKWILDEISNRAKTLQSISKGNSIQIHEAVKLFKAVYEYQGATDAKRLLLKTGLLQIRGPILRNPVSATVYHNYLGLYYRKRAVSVISDQDKTDVPSLTAWLTLKDSLPGENLEKLTRYLSNAKKAFDNAFELSADDPMWRGYILFNQARVEFIEYLFVADTNADPLTRMEQAINARATLNELIEEIMTDQPEDSVLQKHYLYQEEYARQLYVNYCLVLDNSKAKYRGVAVTPGKDYQDLIAKHTQQLLPKNREDLARLQELN